MLDNQVQDMTPGEALLDVPIGDIIQKLGNGIAEAQLRLDQTAARIAMLLGDNTVELRNADGETVERSLLELGFTPTFYHFTEATIEVRMTLTMKVEEGFAIGGTASVGNDRQVIDRALESADVSSSEGGARAGSSDASSGDASSGSDAQSGDDGNRAVLFGAAINVEYHRKYSFEMSGSSLVNVKMVSVPAPTAFLDAIRVHAQSGSDT